MLGWFHANEGQLCHSYSQILIKLCSNVPTYKKQKWAKFFHLTLYGSRDNLELTPESWSLRKTVKEFKVSKTTAQKARILREEKGILAIPQPVIGKRLREKTVNGVLEFYQNDEYSRQLPGKKDCISIGKNVHVSKQFIQT